ncbi:baseplate hub subunit and tail lysozyme [Pantoea phage PdC23]|uniref:Lysozyme n=1 Tax=Pantoea phage PdC23 TaxID=2894356 RepID=A0AAE8YHG7_9CAUD|nr:baseplate hub subunit and tail lysozyme [Pantoea phage PdC23]UGC97740.1 lysozyme [Pantoea phage PdC23]
MGQIIAILGYEEGYRATPYLDTEGFPTVGIGIRIGPKGASLSNYQFSVPRDVADVWLQSIVASKTAAFSKYPSIISALKQCNAARTDIIKSMAYQLGNDGLAGFKNTLAMIAAGNFSGAADGMLNSLWARQTPARAKRHAEVMRTGTYDAYKGLI